MQASWEFRCRARSLILALIGRDLSRANLSMANLSEAGLAQSNLSCAALPGADLSGADLSGADLSGADLSGADLSGADLSGAMLVNSTSPTLTSLAPCWLAQTCGAPGWTGQRFPWRSFLMRWCLKTRWRRQFRLLASNQSVQNWSAEPRAPRQRMTGCDARIPRERLTRSATVGIGRSTGRLHLIWVELSSDLFSGACHHFVITSPRNSPVWGDTSR